MMKPVEPMKLMRLMQINDDIVMEVDVADGVDKNGGGKKGEG